MKKLKLSEVLPNPYRDLKNNPLDQKTIDRLKRSINTTEFWDNVVVRKNKQGKYEQAYGHHRVEAARQCGIKEAEFIVKQFTDEQMIQVMHDDNDEAYQFKSAALLESVRAVVKGLAEGTVKAFSIPKDTPKTKVRYAPSFVPGKPPSPESGERCAYTINNVAVLLRETKKEGTEATEAIKATVNALQLIEEGELTDKSIQGLPLDSKNGGLIQVVQSKMQFREVRQAAAKETAVKVNEVLEQQREAERKNKEAAAKLQQQREDARKAEKEAHRKKATEDAKTYKEKQKELAKKDAERQKKFDAERPQFEEKVKAIKREEEEQVRKAAQELAVRKQIDAFIFKMEAMIDIKGAMQEEINQLFRKVADTTQRMRIRNALSATSTFYDEQSIRFFGASPKQTGGDVLREAQQREDAKRKQKESE